MLQSSRGRWALFLALFAAIGLFMTYSGLLSGIGSRSGWIENHGWGSCPPMSPDRETGELSIPTEPILAAWDSSRVLKGPPTLQVKDNLRDDTWYITAWPSAGFTNQFMGFVNTIYLGMESGRVPIIPPFGPNPHTSVAAGALSFGKVFNLTVARKALHSPILDWNEVKALPSNTSVVPAPPDEREPLGCWSTRKQKDSVPNRADAVVHHLKLDASYTRVPSETRNHPEDPQMDDFVDFHHLIPYIFPKRPFRPGGRPIMEASFLGRRLPPDEKLACFDFLYYVTSSYETFEWNQPWSPAWRLVGTHMHFTDELVEITHGYLARAFQVAEDRIPPFIAVHMRRGDFTGNCKEKGISIDKCVPPIEGYKATVNVVRQKLAEEQNREVKDVIIMSDEDSPAFWGEVKALGWARLDHTQEQTLVKYGEWYLAIIPQIVQSMAIGFVGTQASTFSLVAARRVEDWNNGIAQMVQR